MKSVKISSKIFAAAAAVFIIAAVFAIIWLMCAKPCLVLRDAETGRRYGAYELQEGEPFSVTFVHSVNKSPVTEVYEVRDGDIYVTTCIYSTLGAGVATTLEEGQSYYIDEEGRWVLQGVDTRIDPLIYVVGTVSDHVLELRGEAISLRTLCGRNSKVCFEMRRCLFYNDVGNDQEA